MSSSPSFFDFHKQITESRRAARSPAATAAPAPQVGLTPPDALTVSQLTAQIDRALKSSLPPSVTVRAEVSNYKHHGSSGHAYFTLKDSDACIDCVMFKSDFGKLKFKP